MENSKTLYSKLEVFLSDENYKIKIVSLLSLCIVLNEVLPVLLQLLLDL